MSHSQYSVVRNFVAVDMSSKNTAKRRDHLNSDTPNFQQVAKLSQAHAGVLRH